MSKPESDAGAPAASDTHYDDGAPFDRIQYLEAKLILKPERFVSSQSLRDFGKLARKAAKIAGVGYVDDEKGAGAPQIREIVFLDTPDFALYSNAFILRRRILYREGFPVGDPEIVFKFRHPDQKKAAAVDVRPRLGGAYRIKFKAEALPLKDSPVGHRILFSHNCQFELTDAHNASLETLGQNFPVLASLNRKPGERVGLVNNGIVEEVLLPLGQLDFGKGIKGKCDISLWRTRGEHKSLVGEFAFQAKFEDRDLVGPGPRARAAAFFISLQHEMADWLALGVTKTAMVYRLNGVGPQSHE